MYGQRPVREIKYINTGKGYCYKITNSVLCVILFVLSIGLFGFGIWLIVWTPDFNLISIIMNYDIYRAGCILFIISGILLMIVSFIGLSGGVRERSGLLLAFIIVCIICEIMLIAIATMGLVFNQNFINNFPSNFTRSIQFMYGVNMHISRNIELTNAIDQIQRKYSCCGVSGPTNSSTSWALYQSSTWFITQNMQPGPPYVPTSCCVLNAQQQPTNTDTCQGFTLVGSVSSPAPPRNNTFTLNPDLNVQGCINFMSGTVTYFSMVMFGLALAAALYLIIVMIISCCVVKSIEKGKKEIGSNTKNSVNSSGMKNGSYISNNPNKNSKSTISDSAKSLQDSPSMHTYDDSQKILK